MKMLKSTLPVLNTNRLRMLDTKAGATKRIRGDAWMGIRREALRLGKYQCVDCGRVSLSNEVDHDTPLERGGSNDQTNLRVRCFDCHKAKTVREAGSRAKGF